MQWFALKGPCHKALFMLTCSMESLFTFDWGTHLAKKKKAADGKDGGFSADSGGFWRIRKLREFKSR